MRLGQLARKYNLSQQKIINFLEDLNPGMGPYNQNTKLSDQTEELIAKHFKKSFIEGSLTDESLNIDSENTPIPASPEPQSAAPEPATAGKDSREEAEIQASLDPSLPVPEVKLKDEETIEAPVKAISTDKLIEMLDSEDEMVDLSDITLIKAPKKELEGLKIVGKIDLPEPKPKAAKLVEKEDSPAANRREPRRGNRKLSPEEKEKRRLQAKRKKEAYEAKQERRRKEEAERKLKEKKKAYYHQKIKQTGKTPTKKPRPAVKEADEIMETQKLRAQPKTAIGRFWAWFWRGKKLNN